MRGCLDRSPPCQRRSAIDVNSDAHEERHPEHSID
jgi:hypothetical protein